MEFGFSFEVKFVGIHLLQMRDHKRVLLILLSGIFLFADLSLPFFDGDSFLNKITEDKLSIIKILMTFNSKKFGF